MGQSTSGCTKGERCAPSTCVIFVTCGLARPMRSLTCCGAVPRRCAHDEMCGSSRRSTGGPRCGRPGSPTSGHARRGEEETSVEGVYDLVYSADRPELFFKSVAWRVMTDGEPVGIRRDSALNVPEAELAVVVNSSAEIVGYTVCNDMSSRIIEGENPLYLPQAKLYAGSCALASGIRPAAEVLDPYDLRIELTVTRGDVIAWQASTSTSALYRRLDDLVEWLFRAQSFPDGAILSTGTGLVPDMDFSVSPGDEVRIVIESVGTLTNIVVEGTEPFALVH